MRRYIVFAGDNHYPMGGWNDKLHATDDLEQALNVARGCDRDWSHVVDTEAVFEMGNLAIVSFHRSDGIMVRDREEVRHV